MKSTALEWVEVVLDLFLEHASAARMAEWLDGEPVEPRRRGRAQNETGKIDAAGSSFIVVKNMRAVEGMDATITLKQGHPIALTVWYGALERPSLADAVALFGPWTDRRRSTGVGALFELEFGQMRRPLDDNRSVMIACTIDHDEKLGGISVLVV